MRIKWFKLSHAGPYRNAKTDVDPAWVGTSIMQDTREVYLEMLRYVTEHESRMESAKLN